MPKTRCIRPEGARESFFPKVRPAVPAVCSTLRLPALLSRERKRALCLAAHRVRHGREHGAVRVVE